MIQCFLEEFKPKKLLHREKQEEAIKLTFKHFKDFGFGTNLLLVGVTGSGKTATIKKILSEFDSHIYFSAASCKTSFKILREIARTKSREYPEFIKEIIEKIKRENKILVLDEMNQVEDPRILFDAMNTIYRQTGKPLIIISNNRKIFMDMPEDARLTLFFHKVEFPAYTIQEIKDIIKSRLDLLSETINELVPEDAITQIAIISSMDGSARNALDFTMKCILRNCFTAEFIESLKKEKTRQEWEEFANSLNVNQTIFLNHLLILHRREEEINNRNLRKLMPQFSPQIISMLITDFFKYGIIEFEMVNKGKKGGRYRQIKLDHDIFCKLEGLL